MSSPVWKRRRRNKRIRKLMKKCPHLAWLFDPPSGPVIEVKRITTETEFFETFGPFQDPPLDIIKAATKFMSVPANIINSNRDQFTRASLEASAAEFAHFIRFGNWPGERQ